MTFLHDPYVHVPPPTDADYTDSDYTANVITLTPGHPPTNGQTPEPADDEITLRKAALRARLRTPAEIRDLQMPPPIVPGWISKGDLAIFYGPPKAAKSLLVQDLVNSRGTNRHWLNHTAEPGTTLYLTGEGSVGLGKRNRAWEDHNGTPITGVHYLPGSISLMNEIMVCDITELAAELQVDLIVIDTIARAMAGGDENSTSDMGRLVAYLDYIRGETGAAAIGIHHTGKDETKGMRGSTALLGAVDSTFAVTASGPATSRLVTIEGKDLRDFEPPRPIQARLVPHLESVILEPIESVLSEDLPHPALTCLREIDDPGGVSTSVWLTASELAERTFYRARKDLVAAGLVVNIGTERQPRYRAVDP
jgi:hypothetical protein